MVTASLHTNSQRLEALSIYSTAIVYHTSGTGVTPGLEGKKHGPMSMSVDEKSRAGRAPLPDTDRRYVRVPAMVQHSTRPSTDSASTGRNSSWHENCEFMCTCRADVEHTGVVVRRSRLSNIHARMERKDAHDQGSNDRAKT